MFYTIYKTTNTVNGKYYVGKHQTENPFDGYLGSGRLLKAAIRKYGRDSFSKEVLFVFGSEQEMNQKEIELVTEDVVKDTQSYNVGIGGEGGPHFKGRTHTDEVKELLRQTTAARVLTDETRQRMKDSNWAKKDPEAQREHAKRANAASRLTRMPAGAVSSEVKTKISQAMKEYHASHTSTSKGIKRETIKCPYCNVEGAKNTMNRWHFEKCKKKLPNS